MTRHQLSPSPSTTADVFCRDLPPVLTVSLRPDSWGFTVAAGRDTPLTRRLGLHEGPPAWLLWQIDADTGVATSDRGHTVRIAPFHGVTGVAWDEPGEHSTIPPRPVGGGGIDCRELVVGSVLYLPVAVPGALLSIGDGHAAQGGGEVAGTAIGNGAGAGQPGARHEGYAGSEPVLGRSCAASGGRDHLTGGVFGGKRRSG